MQAETLRDVMDWTRALHGSLAESLKRSAEVSKGERARMLLDYLAEHETRLQKVVELSEQDASVKALNTWCYDYFENAPVSLRRIELEDLSDREPDEIIATVIDMHEMVIDLYRYLMGRAESPTPRELVEGLLDMEEHEAMLMARDARSMEDL